jgi:hypothetical protein
MNTQPNNDKLLQYIETIEYGTGDLRDEEIASLKQTLEENPELRHEAEAISKHLRYLKATPTPSIPSDLANSCLQAVYQKQRSISSWFSYKRFVPIVGFTTFIFIFGLWIGSFLQTTDQPEIPAFDLLLHKQTQLISQLESGLASHYGEAVLTSDNPWYEPITNLKISTKVITVASEKYPNDPVVQRGLSLALAQNISVLQSLCEYIESNETIPDSDVTIIPSLDGIEI